MKAYQYLHILMAGVMATMMIACGPPVGPRTSGTKSSGNSTVSRSPERPSPPSKGNGPATATPTPTTPSTPAQPATPSLPNNTEKKDGEAIFKENAPAVFLIEALNRYGSGSQGSGFFVTSDGIALTNYHVLDDALPNLDKITIYRFSEVGEWSGNGHIKKIYYADEKNDFVVFQVDVQQVTPYIPITTQEAAIGSRVYTIGSPQGLANTFQQGVLSQYRDNKKQIQFDAAIDHGSSGGVLLNAYGEAIGITTSGMDNVAGNFNFAINIQIVKPHIPR